MSGPRIAILRHEREPLEHRDAYLVSWIARHWEKRGAAVEHLYGVRDFRPADLLVLHVDLSVVPDEYLRFAERYPIVVNGRLVDIRKEI